VLRHRTGTVVLVLVTVISMRFARAVTSRKS
jgi:hypothetical protein